MQTPKTTQEFFDNVNWPNLRSYKLSLIVAINHAELLGQAVTRADLRGLLDFIDCLQVAAEAEGYPVFKTRVKI